MGKVIETLIIKVTADTVQAKAGLKGVSSSSASLATKLGAVGVAAGAAFIALKKVYAVAKDYEKAFFKQEEASRKLASALSMVGREADLVDLQGFADDMQKATNVGDEVVEGLLQMATSMGLTATESEKAVKGAIGLSKAFGVSLTSALKMSANAAEGNYEQLKRILPSLRGIKDESELAAESQRLLGDAFSVAEDAADTNAGQAEALSNAIGDLKEVLGESISEGLTPFRKALQGLVEDLTDSLTKTQQFKDALKAEEDGTETNAQKMLLLESALKNINFTIENSSYLIGNNVEVLIKQKAAIENDIEALKRLEAEQKALDALRRRSLALDERFGANNTPVVPERL